MQKNQFELSKIAKLPTDFGEFSCLCFKENYKEHLVIFTKDLKDELNLRIHSECLTGDVFSSLKCDCGAQLRYSLKYIAKKGGMVIYLRQEGRGIGLLNKINAYSLQDEGLDTIEANHKLGFKADERDYKIVDFILAYFKIKKVRLLTNNPNKLASLKDAVRVPVIIEPNKFNKNYLSLKCEKMGHLK